MNNEPLNQELKIVATACTVYIVNPFRVFDVHNKLLQLGRSIEREPRKRDLFPKRSQDVGLEGTRGGTMFAMFAMFGQVGDDVTRHIMRGEKLYAGMELWKVRLEEEEADRVSQTKLVSSLSDPNSCRA